MMEQFCISLHSENLDDIIPWIAFCFPDHNDEPRIDAQPSSVKKLYHRSLLYMKIGWGPHY